MFKKKYVLWKSLGTPALETCGPKNHVINNALTTC